MDSQRLDTPLGFFIEFLHICMSVHSIFFLEGHDKYSLNSVWNVSRAIMVLQLALDGIVDKDGHQVPPVLLCWYTFKISNYREICNDSSFMMSIVAKYFDHVGKKYFICNTTWPISLHYVINRIGWMKCVVCISSYFYDLVKLTTIVKLWPKM